MLLNLLPVLAMTLSAQPPLAESDVARFAELALACVSREYPNKIAHVLNSDADVLPPRKLTPAFYGCFDWHSSVHGHWLLARLLRLNPTAAWAERARAALDAHLTPENIAQEVRYLEGEGRASFERPYGLAWLLALGGELREWARESKAPRVAEAAKWSAALAPLERASVRRLSAWLPKLTHPVRSGEHSQTAFALGLALDWCRSAAPDLEKEANAFAQLLKERARAFFRPDVACPLAYEPSGEDFLSPCLAEADVMRRVLAADEFRAWLGKFLPLEAASALRPAVVSDPSDPKLAHLDGLNLSRAFMLEGIASALTDEDPLAVPLEAAAAAHRSAGLEAVTGKHYEGGHWLGSFATYLVTRRGLGR
jgi:hypothetical protein